MNGAESLVHTLLKSGVDTCFANPGTSEMHFVAALDRIPGMNCVLGLQENVVTGMADGYYRIAGKPACTLLHCGPGLANGLGNIHNARRAGVGMVNIVGDQATYHRPYDAPLTADTEGLAKTMSHWVRTSMTPDAVGRDAAEAVQQARILPGQIATLILPSDSSWDDGGEVQGALPVPAPPPVDQSAVKDAATALRQRDDVLILLYGKAALAPAHETAQGIADATGASLMIDFTNSHVARGQGRLSIERTPYPMDTAIEKLARFKTIILVGGKAPVGFFGYPGMPSIQHDPDADILRLCSRAHDTEAALRALAEELGVTPTAVPSPGPQPEAPGGPNSPGGLAQTVAALMPENSIIVDESISYGRGLYPGSFAAPPHDWLHLGGGAIGDGLPMATGAAIGAEGQRRVIGLQEDGSAMYSLQALWTQARMQLPCTTIILSNRKYNILIGEYHNVGASPGPTAMEMLDLGNPNLSWVQLANGMGVEGGVAENLDQLADLMRASLSKNGPFLIELLI